MVDESLRADIYRFAKNLTVLLGMMSLGAALGLTLGLVAIQDAAYAHGVWPMFAKTQAHPNNAFWVAAKDLQRGANLFAVSGGVLVLSYGIMDRYQNRLMEVLTRG